MSNYDDYITRMCRAGKYTEEDAREFALSKEIEMYYQKTESGNLTAQKSTYMPLGECV